MSASSSMTKAELLEQFKVTSREVAFQLNISPQAVSQWVEIPNARKAQLEQWLGLEPGELGRTSTRQGFRSDLLNVDNVEYARPKGLSWRSENGELMQVPQGNDPMNPPEGHVVVFLD